MTFVPATTLEDVLRWRCPTSPRHGAVRRLPARPRRRSAAAVAVIASCRTAAYYRFLYQRPRLRPCLAADRDHQRAGGRRPGSADPDLGRRRRAGCSIARSSRRSISIRGRCDTGVVADRQPAPRRRATIAGARDFYAHARRARGRGSAAAARARRPLRRRRRAAARPAPRRRAPACRRWWSRTSPGTGSTKDTTRGRGRGDRVDRDDPRAYRQADAAWRLPMHGGFDDIQERRRRAVRRAARQARARRDAAAPRPADEPPLVLPTFGGYGVDGPEAGRARHRRRLARRAGAPTRRHLRRGLRYEDLVRAVDVVVTKPGYGILSECIANDTAVVYTSRGRFADTTSWSARCRGTCARRTSTTTRCSRDAGAPRSTPRSAAPEPPQQPAHRRRRHHCGYDLRARGTASRHDGRHAAPAIDRRHCVM